MVSHPITVEELCNKLRPVFGKKMDEIYLRYAMAQTREEKEEIEQLLNVLYRKHLSELLDKKVLLEPPQKEAMNGTYNLAKVSYAGKKLHPFNLREQDWMRHVCVSGMSGSGKTTLGFHIINNFIEKQKPFLIFDWKKSFRPLLLIDPEIMLFTVGNENISNYFKININEPPEGIPPKEWINVLCDLITESFLASYGVHKILLETLDQAFRDFGVYNGSKNYPTWNEIKWRLEAKLEKKKGREASWLMSALRVAHIMTFGTFGKAMNYKGKENFTINDLLNKKVIFELNALGTVEKKFFCEFILTYIYKLKKARQKGINNNFDHAILVDEAHNIFLKEKTNFLNESVTDMIYREMREYGTSLICLDQHISKISDTVSGNSACLIAFQQQLPQDIDAISGLMQLRDNKNYFSMLPVGSAIVKLSERYTQPFLIEVPNVDLRGKEVSDYDVKGRMKFMFETQEIGEGRDEEFKQQLMEPASIKRITEKDTEEKVRVPHHALFDGEAKNFTNATYSRIGKDDSFKNLDKQEEKTRTVYTNKPTLPENKERNLIQEIAYNKKPKTNQQTPETITQPNNSKAISKNNSEMTTLTIEQNIGLNEKQRILYELIEKKLNKGWHIRQIEKMLEEHTMEGNYTILDIHKAINQALKKRLNTKPTSQTTPEEPKKETTQEPKPQFTQQPATNTQKPTQQKNTTRVIEIPMYTKPKPQLTIVENPKPTTTQQPTNSKKIQQKNTSADDEKDHSEENLLKYLSENPNHTHTTTELYNIIGLSARKGNKVKNKLIEEGKIKVEEIKNHKGWKKIIRLK